MCHSAPRQIGERSRFPGKFLHAVFAEQAQAGGVGFANALRRMRLADRHQGDFFWTASCAARGVAMRSWMAAIFSRIDIAELSYRGHGVPRRETSNSLRITSYRCGRKSQSFANHMIAVGGAGSLGSPAAVTGRKIIKAARPASTIIPPTRYDGVLKICGG